MKNLNLVVLSLLSIMLFASCDQLVLLGDGVNSDENWEFAYAENYVDSLDAIFCRDGYTALFGFQDVELEHITQKNSRAIYVFKTDFESGSVDLDDATVLIVDSTYFPIHIANKDTNIILTKTDDNHFDCASYNFDKNIWEEHSGIEFDLTTSYASSNTRSLSSDGYSIFNYANALQALSISTNVGNVLKPLDIGEQISGGVGLFGDASSLVEDIPILKDVLTDETGLAIGVYLASNLAGASVAVLGYVCTKIDKFVKDVLGDVRISIEDIVQINASSCNISYSVDGLNENGITSSYLCLDIFNYEEWKTVRTTLPSKNGYNTITLNDLKPGKYGAYLRLYSIKYPIINYSTNPLVLFNIIFNLELDRYEVEDDPQYKNGVVNFKLNIFLNGNEDVISKDIKEFGYYIQFANDIDYHKVEHLSDIFSSTPLTLELPIERDGFFERNTSTFEAVATEHYIGVYLVLNNGNIISYDHQEINGLKYTKKPYLTFTGANVINTISEEYDDGYIAYSTEHTISYNVEGAFWLDNLNFGLADGYSDGVGTVEIENGDGAYSGTYYLSYSNESPSFYLYLLGNLYYGGNVVSSNKLVFNGIPVGSISIVGNSSRNLQSRSMINLGKEYGKYYSK